uniref:Uncharacterized protein n=1 Tax=Romanomermis culicivorax TaxID=13658 RepID=A0A915IIM8_ROMCU
MPVYTYPLPTMASVHMLTAEELLYRPTSGIDIEPADEELLDTPIFDLNKAKLLPSTDVSALPMLAAPADLKATAMQTTNFSTLVAVLMDESTSVQPTAMDAQRNTTTDQMLSDIPKESTVDQSTSMDVVCAEPPTMLPSMAPTVDPRIYLATPAILPGPQIIATVAAARSAMASIGRSPHNVPLSVATAQYAVPTPLPGMLSVATAQYAVPLPLPSMLFTKTVAANRVTLGLPRFDPPVA